MMAGLKKPPRLPVQLMSAMPAAAALPPRNDVGFFADFGGYSAPFAFREPLGFDYAVVEEQEDDDAEEDCGDGLQDEEPLPPGHVLAACEVAQDEAGQRTPDDSGDVVS